jgi:hypothetical protein
MDEGQSPPAVERSDGVSGARSRLGLVGALIGLAMAVALGVIRFVGAKGPVRAAEWWIGDLGLAAIVAAPALLALVAVFGRPALFVPAAVISIALSITFLSGAGVPLIIPGVLYLLAFARRPADGQHVPPAAVAVPIVIVGAAYAVLLLGSYRIVCWRAVTYSDGRTEVSRDRAGERASSAGRITQSLGPPGSGVVADEAGCTEGAIDPKRSLLALAGVAGGVLFGRRLA